MHRHRRTSAFLGLVIVMFDFEAEVSRVSKAAYRDGTIVKVDQTLPTLSVEHGNGDSYYFQEHEATAMLVDAELAIANFDISVEDYFAYISQSW